jgi:hypothetical protein
MDFEGGKAIKKEGKGYVPPVMYTDTQKKTYSKLALHTLCVTKNDGVQLKKQMKSTKVSTYKQVIYTKNVRKYVF